MVSIFDPGMTIQTSGDERGSEKQGGGRKPWMEKPQEDSPVFPGWNIISVPTTIPDAGDFTTMASVPEAPLRRQTVQHYPVPMLWPGYLVSSRPADG